MHKGKQSSHADLFSSSAKDHSKLFLIQEALIKAVRITQFDKKGGSWNVQNSCQKSRQRENKVKSIGEIEMEAKDSKGTNFV